MPSHMRRDYSLTQYRKWKGKHLGNGGMQSTCTFVWESFSQNDYVGANCLVVAKSSRLQ